MFETITSIGTPLEELTKEEVIYIQTQLRIAYLFSAPPLGDLTDAFYTSWYKFLDRSFVPQTNVLTSSILSLVREVKYNLLRPEPIIKEIPDPGFALTPLRGLDTPIRLRDPIHLSPTFSWAAATQNGLVPTNSSIISNIKSLTIELERVEEQVKPSFKVVNWLRTVNQNNARRGPRYSFHLLGLAVDIQSEEVSPLELYQLISPRWRYGLAVGPTLVHLDIRNYKARWTYSEGAT